MSCNFVRGRKESTKKKRINEKERIMTLKTTILILLLLLLLGSFGGMIYFIVRSTTKDSTVIPVTKPTEPLETVPVVYTDELKRTWLPLSGHDYNGNDLGEFTFHPDKKYCASRCENTPGCVAGLYNHLTTGCTLKSKLGEATPDPNVTLLVQQDTKGPISISKRKDIDGEEIACYTAGEDATQCAALCAAHDQCKAYTRIERMSGTERWPRGGCCIKKTGAPLMDDLAVTSYAKL